MTLLFINNNKTLNWKFVIILFLIGCYLPSAKAQEKKLNVKKAEITNPNLPRVMLIGNSICSGYNEYVINSLQGVANVDVWITGANVASPTISNRLIKAI